MARTFKILPTLDDQPTAKVDSILGDLLSDRLRSEPLVAYMWAEILARRDPEKWSHKDVPSMVFSAAYKYLVAHFWSRFLRKCTFSTPRPFSP